MGEHVEAQGTPYEETSQTRDIWSTLGSVEAELWQVESMLKAVAALFHAGGDGSGSLMDRDTCFGGEQIAHDILKRFELIQDAYREAMDQTGVRPLFDEPEADASPEQAPSPLADPDADFDKLEALHDALYRVLTPQQWAAFSSMCPPRT